MTIYEVAEMLEDCARGNCSKCKRVCEPLGECESHLLQDMANECRKIAEELEDE